LHKRGNTKFGVALLTATEDNLETNKSVDLDQGKGVIGPLAHCAASISQSLGFELKKITIGPSDSKPTKALLTSNKFFDPPKV